MTQHSHKYFLLMYVAPGMYTPAVNSSRSIEYGSGVLDGEYPTWLGTMFIQAWEGTLPDWTCADVASSQMIAARHIELTVAYGNQITKHIAMYIHGTHKYNSEHPLTIMNCCS